MDKTFDKQFGCDFWKGSQLLDEIKNQKNDIHLSTSKCDNFWEGSDLIEEIRNQKNDIHLK